MKKLRYGIVSTADITSRMIGAIKASQDSEVVAISSRSLEKAQAHAERFDIPKAYGSTLEMLADPEVDIAYIALPNVMHYEAAKTALEHGKHVLCEKPFVLHKQHAIELFALAKSKNLFLMEAQKSVFLPTTQYLKEAITDKRFGPLQRISMDSQFYGRLPERHWMSEANQGGALIPSGSYTLEFLSFLFDAEAEQLAYLINRNAIGMIDEVHFQMRYPGDCLVHACISTRTPSDNVSRFYFEKAQVEIPNHWKARQIIVKPWPKHEPEILEFPVEYEMVYEVDHVYDCIINGKTTSPIMTPERSIYCVEIVEKIQASD